MTPVKTAFALSSCLLLLLLLCPCDCQPLPDVCLKGSQHQMPGALPTDEGYLDFVDVAGGQRTILYYSRAAGVAAELVRAAPAEAAGPGAYRLYNHAHGQDVSSMPNWPQGPCNASRGNESLGPALTELRDSALVGNGTSSPCLVALVAPDLAAAHGHSAAADASWSMWNLTWGANGTACFYDNETARTVWLVSVQLTSNSSMVAEVAGVTLELLRLENATVNAWTVAQRRGYKFLSSQRRPASPEAVAAVANTPAFVACGAARELETAPPAPLIGNLRLATRDLDDDTAAGADETLTEDDLAASRAVSRTLTPANGTRLLAVYGPGRIRLTEDRAAGATLAVGLAGGNCSLVNDSGLLAELARVSAQGPLPFNLADPGWLFTGDGVAFQGRSPCRRFLLLLPAPASGGGDPDAYEVYFRGMNFTDLVGYRRRSGTGGGVFVTRLGPLAAEPVDYDLAACSAAAGKDAGGSKRLLMRLAASFEQLSAVNPAKLSADVRAVVAKATGSAASPLRVAQVSIARDADVKQSQVWFTLLGPPPPPQKPPGQKPPTLADMLVGLKRLVSTGDGVKLSGWQVAKLDEAAGATDKAGCGGTAVVHDGHSGGAMATLAFFMLLIGCGVGVLGAWCVWKRRPNMPYYVQD